MYLCIRRLSQKCRLWWIRCMSQCMPAASSMLHRTQRKRHKTANKIEKRTCNKIENTQIDVSTLLLRSSWPSIPSHIRICVARTHIRSRSSSLNFSPCGVTKHQQQFIISNVRHWTVASELTFTFLGFPNRNLFAFSVVLWLRRTESREKDPLTSTTFP